MCNQSGDVLFARKLVRPFSGFGESEILNEARVITALCGVGTNHPNIVNVLRQGWLPTGPYYFIDMELGDFNLDTYIHQHLTSRLDLNPEKHNSPTFVHSGSSSVLEKAHNALVIMKEIADGLSYMHSLGEVHRDLKPSNSSSIMLLAESSHLFLATTSLEDY
jgi:serine/threonine protein kinase